MIGLKQRCTFEVAGAVEAEARRHLFGLVYSYWTADGRNQARAAGRPGADRDGQLS